MATAMIESRPVGRPKKTVGTVSIRIDIDAQQLIRKACGYTGETVVEYASRVLRDQALKDARAGAKELLRETEGETRRGDR